MRYREQRLRELSGRNIRDCVIPDIHVRMIDLCFYNNNDSLAYNTLGIKMGNNFMDSFEEEKKEIVRSFTIRDLFQESSVSRNLKFDSSNVVPIVYRKLLLYKQLRVS